MKQIQTRLNQRTFRSNDPKKITGKYLTEDARKTWMEDFVDEETGKVVSIERHELIMKRGKLLTADNVSKLSFFFQSGDLKDVEVSTQKRQGFVDSFSSVNLFEVNACSFPISRKYLLHATSVRQAYDIIEDYLELNMEVGRAVITGIKTLSGYSYIQPDEENPESDLFYKAQGMILFTDDIHDEADPDRKTFKFVLRAADVKEANDIVKQHFVSIEKAMLNSYAEKILRRTTVAAQPYPAKEIVPIEFCEAYIMRDRQNK